MRRIFLSFLILCLAACGGGSAGVTTRYEPPGKPGGRLCAFQCRSAHDHCKEGCNLQERGCSNLMQTQAIKDYEEYVRAQFEAHAAVELRPSDFERSEQCVPTGCNRSCEREYNTCFESCGGKIVTTSPCKFMCF